MLITCGIYHNARFPLHAVYITMHGSHYMRYISQCTILITFGIYHNARFSLHAVYITVHDSHFMQYNSQCTVQMRK